MRSEIVARKPEAISYLKTRLLDSDWHVRVLAEAMVQRITAPELATAHEYQMIPPLVQIGQLHVNGRFEDVLVVAGGFEGYRATDPAANRDHSRRLLGASAYPFLLELALKGSVLKKPSVRFQIPADDPQTPYTLGEVARILDVPQEVSDGWMTGLVTVDRPYGPLVVRQKTLKRFADGFGMPDTTVSTVNPKYREQARCWAMLKLGECFNADTTTVPALTELLQSGESATIRGYAALGLGYTGLPDAEDALNRARNDSDSQVRAAVKWGLEDLHRIVEAESRQK